MRTLLSITFLFSVLMGSSQTSVSFSAKTGDAELDATVSSINTQGTANFSLFKKDMSVSFGVTEGKVDYLKTTFKMSAGDIYLALELSKISGKPVDEVAKIYSANKTQGWGVIAKQLGIKPGSKEFHALKNNAKGKNEKMKSNNGKGNPGGKNNSVSPANSKGKKK